MTNILPGPGLKAILSSAKNIYVSGCAAEIGDLPELLNKCRVQDATLTGVFSPMVNHRSYADRENRIRVRTFLLTRALKAHLAQGLVDHCPWRYSMIDRWLTEPGRFDTALVMLSQPDANGRCSFGVQADFLPSFVRGIPRVVGFINPRMPRTAGHPTIDYSSLAAVVDYDAPLPVMEIRATDAASAAIADTIARRTPDGATIQLGIGQIPSEVLARLADHRGLRVHSGVVDENILALEASGALDRDAPVVTGTAIGTARLYEALADQKRFALKPAAFTHAYRNIADTPRFTAINSVLQVDLLGQVSGEAIGGKIAATPGGLPDFVRAAQDSDGGQSIIATRARGLSGKSMGIVPMIENPSIVSSGGSDAHVIVTEFGAVDVRGMTLDERAEAIIGIAAPESCADLMTAWEKMRGGFFGRGAIEAPLAARR